MSTKAVGSKKGLGAGGKSPSRWLHGFCLATLIATFPLIFLGGLVTSLGAGLSVPDWPNSYGYNMFLFPPSMWVGGILYEHTHRLQGTLVGLLAIFQCVVAWRTESRAWVKWLCTAVLLSVIAQGLIGGFRVTEISLVLAILHGIFAQIVLGTMAVACVVTSKWWRTAPNLSAGGGRPGRVVWLAMGVAGLVVLQLVAGAMMRHKEAGLAIPDLPLAYGRLIPPTDAAGLAAANSMRLATGESAIAKPVTMYKVWLHFSHRVGAVVVTTGVLALAWLTIRRGRGQGAVVYLGWLLIPMITAQVALGLATIYFRKPADIATVHHTLGAILLMTVVVLGVRAGRLFWARSAEVTVHAARAAGAEEGMVSADLSDRGQSKGAKSLVTA